jgi:hypothetical protein
MPVYTQHPEIFETFHDNVILPEKAVPAKLNYVETLFDRYASHRIIWILD